MTKQPEKKRLLDARIVGMPWLDRTPSAGEIDSNPIESYLEDSS